MNCGCCRPEGPADDNVSPASLLEVEFLSGGAYIYHPADPDWAVEIHQRLPDKQQRQAKQKEWCLENLPIGPFDRHAKIFVPAKNAFELEKDGTARSTGRHQLSWFCQRKESFLSREIVELNDQISAVGALLESREKTAVQQYGVLAPRALEDDLDHFYASRFKEKLGELLTFIPTHLFSPKSRFFLPELSRSIKALQTQTLDSFKQFTQEEGGKFVHASRSKAFIKGDSGLSLAQKFGRQNLIPVPRIKGKRQGVYWR